MIRLKLKRKLRVACATLSPKSIIIWTLLAAAAPMQMVYAQTPAPAASDSSNSGDSVATYLPATPTATYTLDQVLSLAVNNSLSDRRQLLTVDQANADIDVAKSKLRLDVHPTAVGSISSNPNSSIGSGDNGLSVSRERARVGLTAGYVLSDGGVKADDVKIAREKLRQIEDINATRNATELNDATAAFYDLLQLQREYDSAQLAYDATDELLRTAKARLDLGQVTKGDVLTAQAALSANISTQQTIAQGLARARARLASVLDADPTKLVPTVEDPAESEPIADTLDAFVQDLVKYNPAYDQLESEKDAAVIGLHQVKATSQPVVTIGADGGLSLRDSGGKSSAKPFIGASLDFIFADLDRYGAKAAERSQADEVAIRDEAAEEYLLTLREQVADAYSDYQSSVANVDQDRIALDAAQQARVLAQGRYAAGTGTQADILAANSTLSQARLRLNKTLNDRDVAIRTLNFVSGRDQLLHAKPAMAPVVAKPAVAVPTAVTKPAQPSATVTAPVTKSSQAVTAITSSPAK